MPRYDLEDLRTEVIVDCSKNLYCREIFSIIQTENKIASIKQCQSHHKLFVLNKLLQQKPCLQIAKVFFDNAGNE